MLKYIHKINSYFLKKGNNNMHVLEQDKAQVISALKSFPYFVLRNEIEYGYNLYTQELQEIQRNYINYDDGTKFQPTGTSGDYVPSMINFKLAKTLLNKEARFMFSQTPEVVVVGNDLEEQTETSTVQYQHIIDEVIRNSKFSKKVLQSAKDCFIGKRVAGLVDISEQDGIRIHFYNALQFYYETDYDTERLTKFISFENILQSKRQKERKYLVNRYEEINGVIYVSSILYNGSGKVIEELVPEHTTDLQSIPAVIITNDGTLEDKRGVSEIEDLMDEESAFSKLANADVDSEHKGMNPIRYTVDMNGQTTKNLNSGAGAYWDLRSEQNQNEIHPMVGLIAPAMNHVEAVKTTLERIKTSMYGQLDVPNISEETMVGTITSGKALKALYYPLQVRCDEKMKTWKPALQELFSYVLELAKLNADIVKEQYKVEQLQEVQYTINVNAKYALMEDEQEEKDNDIAEINANARSRKSYIKKWRKDEFKTDAQIDEELMQIALEQNMFDTLSMNTNVQTELNKQQTEQTVEEGIEEIDTQNKLENL